MKYGDMIVAIKDIPNVAKEGKVGLFYCFEDGKAVCGFSDTTIWDGRVRVDISMIRKVK